MFLTGLPAGIVPGFQNNTGKVLSDLVRLNDVVDHPASVGEPRSVVAEQPKRVRIGRGRDRDVTIELRALAGVTYALVDKSFTPDAAATKVTQGVATPPIGPPGTARFLPYFPYLGLPTTGLTLRRTRPRPRRSRPRLGPLIRTRSPA